MVEWVFSESGLFTIKKIFDEKNNLKMERSSLTSFFILYS